MEAVRRQPEGAAVKVAGASDGGWRGEQAAGEASKRLADVVRTSRRCKEGQQACLDSMRAEGWLWESLWRRVWRLEEERGDEEDR